MIPYRMNEGQRPATFGRSRAFPQKLWSIDLAINSLIPDRRMMALLGLSLPRKLRSRRFASSHKQGVRFISHKDNDITVTLPIHLLVDVAMHGNTVNVEYRNITICKPSIDDDGISRTTRCSYVTFKRHIWHCVGFKIEMI